MSVTIAVHYAQEALMATLARVPVEIYLHSSYEPDAEYVDGEIEERPMGQYDHVTWQYAIMEWFSKHKRNWNIRVRAELRVQVSATRYRVPDVVVFDRALPIEQILTHPPIAVFEILSPEDRIPRFTRKLSDYERMGIRTIVVVDPEDQTIHRLERGVLEKMEYGVQEIPGSKCSIDWVQVLEGLKD